MLLVLWVDHGALGFDNSGSSFRVIRSMISIFNESVSSSILIYVSTFPGRALWTSMTGLGALGLSDGACLSEAVSKARCIIGAISTMTCRTTLSLLGGYGDRIITGNIKRMVDTTLLIKLWYTILGRLNQNL